MMMRETLMKRRAFPLRLLLYASGYTMNKAALKALVVTGFPNYFPHAHTFSEDTMVAKVFRKMGVYPYETKDENGSERYMVRISITTTVLLIALSANFVSHVHFLFTSST